MTGTLWGAVLIIIFIVIGLGRPAAVLGAHPVTDTVVQGILVIVYLIREGLL